MSGQLRTYNPYSNFVIFYIITIVSQKHIYLQNCLHFSVVLKHNKGEISIKEKLKQEVLMKHWALPASGQSYTVKIVSSTVMTAEY